jgi:hypothetical protein
MEEQIQELARQLYKQEIEGLESVDVTYAEAQALAKWHLEAIQQANKSAMFREEGQHQA